LLLGRDRGDLAFTEQVGLAWRWDDAWWLAGGLVLEIVVAIIVGGLIRLLPGEPTRQAVVEVASGAGRGLEVLLLVLLLGVVAPVVEEIVHRGVLLSALRRRLSPWPAIVTSAAVFAAIHLVDPGAIYAVPGLFLIGIALGWLALATGDIGVPIAVHAGVNLTGVLLLVFAGELEAAAGVAAALPG
jgi:membrane protease YdiL (CAAX protease family)